MWRRAARSAACRPGREAGWPANLGAAICQPRPPVCPSACLAADQATDWPASRAEQSRAELGWAEQTGAEQTRAEQTRAKPTGAKEGG